VKKLTVFVVCFIACYSLNAQKPSVSFEQWISLKQVNAPVVSPNGAWVLYSIQSTDWTANRYDNELWLASTKDSTLRFQLTRTNQGSSSNGQFSPDSKWVTFLADRGNKNQIYLISPTGGEALPLTNEETGIDAYQWSPNGKKIAFLTTNAESKKEKNTTERFGGFEVEDEGFKQNTLWSIRFNYDSIAQAGLLPCDNQKKDTTKSASKNPCPAFPVPEQLLKENYYISNFEWNPDSQHIIFDFQPDSRIKTSLLHTDIAWIHVADKKTEVLIHNPASDNFQKWSKDGKYFVYSTHLEDTTSNFYTNIQLFIYDVDKKTSREILGDFDEEKGVVEWDDDAIYFTALEKMKTFLFVYDVKKNQYKKAAVNLDLPGGFSFSKDHQQAAVTGRNFNSLNELYLMNRQFQLQQVTKLNAQIEKWDLPVNQIIRWKSKDDHIIEGVLLKPKNFDAHKKYPLLVVIHGGPTGVDRPEPVPTYVYPIMQWCAKGAVVLRVNYRGSAGYGARFRSLNVNNLGVGDMWDVVSGVDYLVRQGFVDTAKMGCMGWSQGGYISAFLTTNTTIFKAISVGAGISDWMTYYVNTDITPFTPQYLKSTPWSNPAIYQKTSPITNITHARTPTLIQHGEFDKRVPVPNGYELYRGLLDNGVPAKLIIYKGFGHGISKPKERLAATWHNWTWFNHYVFGDKMEELPVSE